MRRRNPSPLCQLIVNVHRDPKAREALHCLSSSFMAFVAWRCGGSDSKRFQGLRERFTRLVVAAGLRQDLAAACQPSLLSRRLLHDPGEPNESRVVAPKFQLKIDRRYLKGDERAQSLNSVVEAGDGQPCPARCCERARMLENVLGIRLREPGKRACVVFDGGFGSAETGFHTRASPPCLGIVRMSRHVAVQKELRRLEVTRLEQHSSFAQVHDIQRRVEAPRLPIIRLCRAPVVVNPVQLRAFQIEFRVARLACDAPAHFFDLFVDWPMAQCGRGPDEAHQQKQLQESTIHVSTRCSLSCVVEPIFERIGSGSLLRLLAAMTFQSKQDGPPAAEL